MNVQVALGIFVHILLSMKLFELLGFTVFSIVVAILMGLGIAVIRHLKG